MSIDFVQEEDTYTLYRDDDDKEFLGELAYNYQTKSFVYFTEEVKLTAEDLAVIYAFMKGLEAGRKFV